MIMKKTEWILWLTIIILFILQIYSADGSLLRAESRRGRGKGRGGGAVSIYTLDLANR